MSEWLRILPDTGAEVMPLPRVVLLGDSGTAEFSSVWRSLRATVSDGTLTQIRNLTELSDLCCRGEFPDLLVVVQTWSDEFPFRELLKLPSCGPLSRVLCCYGPWCISDGRSRQDWPLALRIPLEHIDAALRREMHELTIPDRAEAPLHWTAGRDEIFGNRQLAIAAGSAAGSRCVIRVVSSDRQLAETWVELLRKAGFPIAADGAAGGGQLVLWDVDPWNAERLPRWTEFRHRFPAAKMVALAGFVSPAFASELLNLGAIAVVSKLLPWHELLAEIQALAAIPQVH